MYLDEELVRPSVPQTQGLLLLLGQAGQHAVEDVVVSLLWRLGAKGGGG